jgi:hypothetical protein
LVIFNSKYALDTSYKYYDFPVITENAYNALTFLKDDNTNKTIITPYFSSSAVYPISKDEVIALIPAQMDGGYVEGNLFFYVTTNCTDRLTLIEESDATHVISPISIDCDFLDKIEFPEYFIYTYNNG